MRLKIGFVFAGIILAVDPALFAQRSHTVIANPLVAVSPKVTARAPSPNLGGRPYPLRNTIPTPTGLIAPAASYTGITPGALRSTQNHLRNRNFGLGYGGFNGAPFLPYTDTGFYSGFPSYSEQAEAIGAQANAQAQDALARQMDQMNAEIQQLRDQQWQALGVQPGQPEWAPPPRPPATAEAQPPQAPIILVLANGARLSVINYAVMNNVIWDFSKQPARKIQVSSINITASQKATEDNGGEFPQLSSSR